jgi:hypothetical protein
MGKTFDKYLSKPIARRVLFMGLSVGAFHGAVHKTAQYARSKKQEA